MYAARHLNPIFFRFFYNVHLRARCVLEHFIQFRGIQHIMQSQSVIVVNDALCLRLPARVPAGKHLAYFIVIFVLGEIFEILDVVRVITEHPVKGRVAIL